MAVQDYKINYKSDFVLNINGDAGWATQFCIKFWTGMPSQAYFVGFDGVKYVNCRVGDTPTQLLVMFDDHHLPIGKLMMQIAYHTTIEEFPGSVFDEVTNARDVIVTIDGTDYQVMLDFTGEDAPELEFDLPAYANEAERIQNELQRQQNEADRIAAELQREQATAAAVQGAENVNAQLNGTTLTVTNRNGVSTSVNTKGEQGEQGPVGPEGPQGEMGMSIVSFLPKSETATTLIYTITYSNGHTQDVAIPKGPKGDTGATGPTGPQGPQGDTGVSITGFVETGETETATLYNITFSNGTTQQVAIPKGEKGDQGPAGPTGPQGPMGDVAVITPEQQAAFTMYSTTGQNTNGPMTQKAVTDALVAEAISYDNSQSGLASDDVQGAVDEVADNVVNIREELNVYETKTVTFSVAANRSARTNIPLVGGREYIITTTRTSGTTGQIAVNTFQGASGSTGYVNVQSLFDGELTKTSKFTGRSTHPYLGIWAQNASSVSIELKWVVGNRLNIIEENVSDIEQEVDVSESKTIAFSVGSNSSARCNFPLVSGRVYTLVIKRTSGTTGQIAINTFQGASGSTGYVNVGSLSSGETEKTIEFVGRSTHPYIGIWAQNASSCTMELSWKRKGVSDILKNLIQDDAEADLDLVDNTGNVIARFKDGHIKTKYFDSAVGGVRHYNSFVVLGDSYSTFNGYNDPVDNLYWYPHDGNPVTVEDTWWYLFAKNYHAAMLQNNSYSGSPICYDGWGEGTADAAATSFCGRAGNLKHAELIIVFGGTNDSRIGVNLGDYQYSGWTETDKQKFRPACAYLLDYLQHHYIGSEILFIENEGLDDGIITSIDTICEHYGVDVLKLSGISKINGHPDVSGMQAISNQLINILNINH